MNNKINPIMKLVLVTILNLFLFQNTIAQAPPDTEVYMISIQKKGNNISLLENSKLINISNNKGYDNQPSFIEKLNAVAYVSSRNDAPTDVYLYDIEKAVSKQLTNNNEAEYSPKITPDGKNISIVKDIDQNLTQVSFDGSITEKLYTSKDSIGYFCWLNNTEIAAFVLSKPKITLKLIDIKNKTEKYLTDSIGRSLYKHKEGVVVCRKLHNNSWVSFVDKNGTISQWIQLPPNTEDFYFTQSGWLFTSKDSSLMYCNVSNTNKEWKELANLKSLGISKIARLSVNNKLNKLVFVSEVQH